MSLGHISPCPKRLHLEVIQVQGRAGGGGRVHRFFHASVPCRSQHPLHLPPPWYPPTPLSDRMIISPVLTSSDLSCQDFGQCFCLCVLKMILDKWKVAVIGIVIRSFAPCSAAMKSEKDFSPWCLCDSGISSDWRKFPLLVHKTFLFHHQLFNLG